MTKNLKRINNINTSIRLVGICKYLGIKTIYSLSKSNLYYGLKVGRYKITNSILKEIQFLCKPF